MAQRDLNPWERACVRLRDVLDEHSYKNWFSQTAFESCEDGCLKVVVPSPFFATWLEDHYQDTVTTCAREVIPEVEHVRFVVAPAATGNARGRNGHTARPETRRPSSAAQSGTGRMEVAIPEPPPVLNGFNRRYTFDRFVVGAGNRFAHAAARAVAEAPARAYNPLFMYGDTGLGKTHLMQALGQEVVRRKPDAKVVFISSEQFTNQLIESIAKKSTVRFRAKYRKVDLLLIDDIHFIAGKEATQEEFFHTFNELFDMHKQIVIASDRQPKEMNGVEERLISRFEWGLVTDIQPPDTETRIAILQSKAAEEGGQVPAPVFEFIANHVTSNIRELEGALITLLAYSKLNGAPVTMGLAEDVLHDLVGRDKIRTITADAVQRAVAERFDVRIADLKGRSRQRAVSYPRQIAMYLCKDLIPSLSLNEIGEAFGGKDHTTVLHSCRKIAGERGENNATRQILDELTKLLRG